VDYTRRVAEFVAGTWYEDLPAGAVSAAKEAILDSVGVALAGSREAVGRIGAELAREERAAEEAALFGHGFRSTATTAALVNGTAAHALDFDASFMIMGQPMAGLMPTVFALAEPLGASGRQLLEAHIAGFEVTAKLAWSMPAHWSEGGWHATATVGSLGCTAAAARLPGLGVDEIGMALGIVSSMAGGVVGSFGTMSKPLHAGLAARNGVLAAKLAGKGFTGNPATLEAPNGFVDAFAPGMPPDFSPLEKLGTTYDVESGVRYKASPCGGLTHGAIDAVLALRREDGFVAEAIDRLDVQVTSYTASRIVYGSPETELQAKFSMAYILARAALDGAPTPDTFSDEAIREPAALALAERVHMEVDPELENDASGRRPCRVTIHLKDGRSLFRQVDYPKGSPEAPFGPGELQEKFRACARRALDEKAASEAMDLLDHLETVDHVGSLSRLLMGSV